MKLGDLFPELELSTFVAMLRHYEWGFEGPTPQKLKVLAAACAYAYSRVSPWDKVTDRGILIPSIIHLAAITDLLDVPPEAELSDPGITVLETALSLALIIKTKRRAIIAVRGTQNLYDLNVDLTAQWIHAQDNGLEGLCHLGFWDAGIELFHALKGNNSRGIDYLEDLDEVAISGHSLGGAIAALVEAQIKHAYQIKIDLACVFGSPRIGNSKLCQCFGNVHFIVRDGDFVPGVPPRMIYVNPNSIFRLHQGSVTRLGPREAPVRYFNPLFFKSEHSIERYMRDAFQVQIWHF